MSRHFQAVLIIVVLGGLGYVLYSMCGTTFPQPPCMRDMANLKQISLACLAYAVEHGNQYPADWTGLGPYVSHDARLFVRWQGDRPAGSMTNVMEWTDYVYVRGRTLKDPADSILAFLPPGVHTHRGQAGAAVVFMDGRVKWMSVEEFTKAMNRGGTISNGASASASGASRACAKGREVGVNGKEEKPEHQPADADRQ